MRRFLDPPIVVADESVFGRNVIIEPGVEIYCKRIILGDGVVIKSGTLIQMTDLVIGDYTVINNHSLLTGTSWCRIGHNCWFGHFSVIDSIGTTRIGDGVGVGAHSQLWTHIHFGDVLEGCRFSSQSPLVIEDDVWFVGHCIVSPIKARKRSMAMAGSVVTKDMEENHCYAGAPAVDVTDRLGPQFAEVPLEEKGRMLHRHLRDFLSTHKPRQNRIRIVDRIDPAQMTLSQFSVIEREYTKNLYDEEVQFIRYLHPTKAKFLPHRGTDWIQAYLGTP